jgi:acyl carrier protein
MTQEELRRIVDEALGNVAPEADLSALADSAELRMDLDIDSIGFLEFITELHEKLGIDIPEIDYPRLVTRGDVLGYLAPKLG